MAISVDALMVYPSIVKRKQFLSTCFIKFLTEKGKKIMSKEQWEKFIEVMPVFEKEGRYDL